MNITNYLDLYDVFANELIGDIWLMIIISLVLVWFLTVKAKMPFEMSILFGLLLLSIFFAQTQFVLIWILLVLVVGSLFYYSINKIIK